MKYTKITLTIYQIHSYTIYALSRNLFSRESVESWVVASGQIISKQNRKAKATTDAGRLRPCGNGLAAAKRSDGV